MEKTYQEFIDCQWHLVLRARDSDCITCFFSAGESDLAVELLLELINLVQTSNQLSVVQAIDVNGLGDKLCISFLDHVHDLLLYQVQILGIARRRTTNYIIDLDVVLLLAVASAVHGVGELYKDGVFLHDALDVLTADADDALVVLVGHVERDGSRHLLLDKIKTVLRSVILGAAYYDVEVVLVEAVEDDLHAAVAHDLVDLAVLLTADKFFMLIGELDLHAHVVLRLLDKGDVANHHQSSSYSVVGAVNVEIELLKADFSTRVDANVREHGAHIG
jgi:hypothetical protein